MWVSCCKTGFLDSSVNPVFVEHLESSTIRHLNRQWWWVWMICQSLGQRLRGVRSSLFFNLSLAPCKLAILAWTSLFASGFILYHNFHQFIFCGLWHNLYIYLPTRYAHLTLDTSLRLSHSKKCLNRRPFLFPIRPYIRNISRCLKIQSPTRRGT